MIPFIPVADQPVFPLITIVHKIAYHLVEI